MSTVTTTVGQHVGRHRAVLLGLLAAVLLPVLAAGLGLRLLVVTSDSMEPTFGSGTLAVAWSVPTGDVALGDTVSVVRTDGARVTHRVVGVDATSGPVGLVLRGDANPAADTETYSPARVDRVVLAVPALGHAVAGARDHALLLVGAGALLAAVLLVRRRGLPGPLAPATLAAAVLVGSATTTGAYWTDEAGIETDPSSAHVVPAPVISCYEAVTDRVRIDWDPVPGATSYTVHHGLATTTTTLTSFTIETTIFSEDAYVIANRAYPSVTWSSQPSNTLSYSVGALSVCM